MGLLKVDGYETAFRNVHGRMHCPVTPTLHIGASKLTLQLTLPIPAHPPTAILVDLQTVSMHLSRFIAAYLQRARLLQNDNSPSILPPFSVSFSLVPSSFGPVFVPYPASLIPALQGPLAEVAFSRNFVEFELRFRLLEHYLSFARQMTFSHRFQAFKELLVRYY